MVKLILLVKRKASLSFEEFRNHYETIHAPLAKAKLSHLRRYCRNYLQALPGQEAPVYDCVTEFWFDDADALAATMDFVRTPEGKVLAEDEERFMDRASMRTYIGEETNSLIER